MSRLTAYKKVNNKLERVAEWLLPQDVSPLLQIHTSSGNIAVSQRDWVAEIIVTDEDLAQLQKFYGPGEIEPCYDFNFTKLLFPKDLDVDWWPYPNPIKSSNIDANDTGNATKTE